MKTEEPWPIVSRAVARLFDLRLYRTEKMCKRGHVSERRTDNGTCCECIRAYLRALAAADPEKYRARKRHVLQTWRADNPEKCRAWASIYRKKVRAADPEKARAQDRARYLNNPERVLAQQRKVREADPEKYRARKRKAYADNSEKICAQQRKVREADPEKFRARRRKARKDNPGKFRIEEHKKDMKRRGAYGRVALTKHEAFDLYDFVANRPPNCHVDHIVPLQGVAVKGVDARWNVQYLPGPENSSKHNKYDRRSMILERQCFAHFKTTELALAAILACLTGHKGPPLVTGYARSKRLDDAAGTTQHDHPVATRGGV